MLIHCICLICYLTTIYDIIDLFYFPFSPSLTLQMRWIVWDFKVTNWNWIKKSMNGYESERMFSKALMFCSLFLLTETEHFNDFDFFRSIFWIKPNKNVRLIWLKLGYKKWCRTINYQSMVKNISLFLIHWNHIIN